MAARAPRGRVRYASPTGVPSWTRDMTGHKEKPTNARIRLPTPANVLDDLDVLHLGRMDLRRGLGVHRQLPSPRPFGMGEGTVGSRHPRCADLRGFRLPRSPSARTCDHVARADDDLDPSRCARRAALARRWRPHRQPALTTELLPRTRRVQVQ